MTVDLESYAHLSSPVHAWDPRFKLTTGFLLLMVCASVTRPPALAAAAFAALVLIAVSRLPLRFVLRMLKAPLLLLALMLPLLVLTAGGPALWSWGFLHLYRNGLMAAARIAAKALTVFLLFVGLFATVRLNTALRSLQYLKVPSTLLMIFMFTYRYIYLYLEDLRKLLTAARLRGYNLQRGLRHLRATSGILVNLLLRSYEQSERVAAAMRLRGFDGCFHSLEELRYRPADLLAALFAALWMGLLLWLDLR